MKEKTESTRLSNRTKLWSGYFVLLIAASCFLSMVGSGLNTGTSVYVGQLGGTVGYAGFLAMVFSLSAGVCRIIAGPIIDRGMKTRIACAGAALLVLSSALPVFFSDLGPLFTIAKGLQGVGFALSTTACAVAAEEILPYKRLGEGVGYFGLSQAFAQALGPALGLILVAMDPPSIMFLGLTLIALVPLAFFSVCRYDKKPEKLPEDCAFKKAVKQPGSARQSRKLTIRDVIEPRALPAAIPMALFSAGSGFFIYFAAKYGLDVGIENTQIIFLIEATTMVILRASSGAFMDKISPRIIFTFGSIAGICCFTLFLLAMSQPVFFYPAGFFFGIAMGVCSPTCQTVAVKLCPPERWGAATAMVLLSMDVGIGAGCILWGFLVDLYGYGAVFIGINAFMLVALLCAWLLFPQSALHTSK